VGFPITHTSIPRSQLYVSDRSIKRPTIVDLGSGDEPSDSEKLSSDLENIDAEFFKTLLQECLDQVEHEGSFATFTRHATFPNPSICVKDFGVFGIPLSDRDAKAIAALCKK
jgi:hypothetical protein